MWILLPLSNLLGFSKFDLTCKIFEYGEDFFQTVSIAGIKYLILVGNELDIDDPIKVLEEVQHNSNVYNFLYFVALCLPLLVHKKFSKVWKN